MDVGLDEDDDNDGILDIDECTNSNFQWSNVPTASGNTATGTINGIAYTYNSFYKILHYQIYLTTVIFLHRIIFLIKTPYKILTQGTILLFLVNP